MADNDHEKRSPLCVDCDGTIIKTDLLFESFFVLFKQSPYIVLLLPFWLFRGRAFFKQRIAERVDLDVTLLPYNIRFLNFLREEKARGRTLVLVTASPRKFADQIAAYLNLFHRIIASDSDKNIRGQLKADSLATAFGEQGFEYAANSRVDIAVWKRAQGAILVNASPRLQQKVAKFTRMIRTFPTSSIRPHSYLQVLRLHQWLKNLLVFVPLFSAHLVHDLGLVSQAAMAFLAYCLTASSTYVLNDLLDLSADRSHPRKGRRPFAAGDIPIARGFLFIPSLLVAAFALTLFLPANVVWLLGGYCLTTLAYSLWIKQRALLDVVTLASLYSCRILTGGAATGIHLSFWLLAFSMFIFLSLALVKRYSELQSALKNGKETASGRGYHVDDLPLLESLGTSSAYLAVLVLALYINSSDVTRLYSRPMWLWLLCPLLLYWISRIWMKTHRGEMHDDPLVFALWDRQSQLITLLGVFGMYLATYKK
jgi:4-hydroxybenzoate polyprenyltransferase